MSQSRSVYQSRSLTLDQEEMSILVDGVRVRLPPTAFRILTLLARNAGRLVTKEDILKEVWAGRVVEEANISQNIFTLRNALAQLGLSRDLIANEPGRGYRFIGEVIRSPSAAGKSVVPFAKGRPETQDFPLRRRQVAFGNLPIPPTPLIGREREVSELGALIGTGESRFTTLTGGPGSGKSALALWIAATVASCFPDGVVFVPLAGVPDADMVPAAVAQTLALGELHNRPILEVLDQYFQSRQMLVVLDNFEQVLSARRYVAEWLSRAGRLSLLISSRTVLNLRGEMDYPVMPLPVPDLKKSPRNTLNLYPSVQLFAQRARLAQPGFSLTRKNDRAIAEICARVGGLPGAIELAAAKIKILDPAALLARMASSCLDVLGDGPHDLALHQQRMRTTVEWSYNLLSDPDQILLRRLSVFAGGFTIEAAEAICTSVNGVAVDVLEGVASLRNNSLVWPTTRKLDSDFQRFTMHEVVREYGLECLSRGEEEPVRRAHVDYFRRAAEDAEPRLVGDALIETIKLLDMEAGNLRAAVRWSVDHDPESAIGIIAALRRYWQVRAQHRWARTQLDSLLRQYGDAKTLIRARGLAAGAELAFEDSDNELALAMIVDGVQLFRDLGEKSRLLALNMSLGASLLVSGELGRARMILLETLAEARQAGDRRCIAFSLMDLGACAYFLGDLEQSLRWYRECLAAYRDLNDRWGLSGVLNDLGMALTRAGDFRQAWSAIKEGLTAAIDLDYAGRIAECVETAAELASAAGAIETALRLVAAAEALRERCFAPRLSFNTASYQEVLRLAREQLSEQDFDKLRAEGSSMTMDELCEYALGLELPL
jgi:predicted ATPase/DNA-binding winged helix-turn-helix (wHTH) protein